MRFGKAFASLAAVLGLSLLSPSVEAKGRVKGEKRKFNDVIDVDERERALQEVRLNYGKTRRLKKGKKGGLGEFEFEELSDILEAVVLLAQSPRCDIEGGLPPWIRIPRRNLKQAGKRALKGGDDADFVIPEQCDNFYDVLEAIFGAFYTFVCEDDEEGSFIGALFAILATCGIDALNNECPITGHCVEKFDDGGYCGASSNPIDDSTPESRNDVNQYAWGGDYNAECGYGVMIHSAGTPGLISDDPTLPTLTLRDTGGGIVYEGNYATGQETLGVRSARVVDCDEHAGTVTVLAPSIQGSVGSGTMAQFNVFVLTLADYDMITPVDIMPTGSFPAASPSVRSMVQDGNIIYYVPFGDLAAFSGIVPIPTIVAVDYTTGLPPVGIPPAYTLVDDDGDPIFGHFIWEYECRDGQCWVSMVQIVGDDDKAGGFDFIPKLYVFDESALGGANNMIEASLVETELEGDSSVFALSSIGEDSVVACTLSGFVYQVAASFGLNRKLQDGSLLEFGDSFLAGVELGEGQECNVCRVNAESTGKGSCKSNKRRTEEKPKPRARVKGGTAKTSSKTKQSKAAERRKLKGKGGIGQCEPIGLSDQPDTTAYIWSVQHCGDYVFTGSLDIASIAGGIMFFIIQQIIVGIYCGGDEGCMIAKSLSIRGFLSEFPTIQPWIESLLVSLLFNDLIHPCDFGFDIWYAHKDELLLGAEEGCLPEDIPEMRRLTANGFRDVDSNCMRRRRELFPVDIEDALCFWPFPFDPRDQVDDGVRNMVCHDDGEGSPKLVVGSAVYGNAETSNTYVIDVNSVETCNPSYNIGDLIDPFLVDCPDERL